MSEASAIVDIDGELFASAEAAAGARTVEEQIGYWIRVGMAVDRSPHVSKVRVQAVLDGAGGFADLNILEPAVQLARLHERGRPAA